MRPTVNGINFHKNVYITVRTLGSTPTTSRIISKTVKYTGRLRAQTYSPKSFNPEVTLIEMPTSAGSSNGDGVLDMMSKSVRLQKLRGGGGA
jgi:hypothetical protein